MRPETTRRVSRSCAAGLMPIRLMPRRMNGITVVSGSAPLEADAGDVAPGVDRARHASISPADVVDRAAAGAASER